MYTCLHRLLPEKRRDKTSSAASRKVCELRCWRGMNPQLGCWGETSGCCLASRAHVMESPNSVQHNNQVKLLARNHESSNPSRKHMLHSCALSQTLSYQCVSRGCVRCSRSTKQPSLALPAQVGAFPQTGFRE